MNTSLLKLHIEVDTKSKGRIFSARSGDNKTSFHRLYHVIQEIDGLEDISITTQEHIIIIGVIEDKMGDNSNKKVQFREAIEIIEGSRSNFSTRA